MSARTSAELIEGYVARLKAELDFVGAAEADDLVAEIRSLLVEAAGDDVERAAAEIGKCGEPAELASGILAEKGLSPADGMSTAEWWRMGIAVPLDIVIGVAVPLAVALPAYMIAANAEPRFFAVALALALAAASLLWCWNVWRPWRTGGPRLTAGMVLTGLAVVRAPGFRRVVRSRDLEALGMRPRTRGALFGMVTLAIAIVMLGTLGTEIFVAMTASAEPSRVFDQVAGTRSEQRRQVVDTVDRMYAGLVRSGSNVGGEGYVSAGALSTYEAVVLRAQRERIAWYEIGEPTKLSVGAWKVPVIEKTTLGTHEVAFTLTLRILLQPGDETGYGYETDWEIYEISGEGLKPEP